MRIGSTPVIQDGTADGDDTSTLTEKTRSVTQHVSTLAALREVREWHAADVAAAQVAASRNAEQG